MNAFVYLCVFALATGIVASSEPVQCGPVCAIACPYGQVKDGTNGNEKDANGCPICQCNQPPIDPETGCPSVENCPWDCPDGRAFWNGCEVCHCANPNPNPVAAA